MRGSRELSLVLAGCALLAAVGTLLAWRPPARFDHWQHRKLFPSCLGCHAGIAGGGAAAWPAPARCAECHDGAVEPKVDWSPPARSVPSNLRFGHATHAQKVAAKLPADSVVRCTACHAEGGAPWMAVQRSVVPRCLDCHGVTADHLAAPDTACATCHLTLVQARELDRARIARFPAPPSHEEASFAARHGKLASTSTPAGEPAVARSCATCHARDFCISCHVNAPEVPAIQALGPDERASAIEVKLEAPASHQAPDFLTRHGKQALGTSATCATCHTQESCLTCHTVQPRMVRQPHPAGPGRARGPALVRSRPVSHGEDFTDRHRAEASAAGQRCEVCHTRAECLDCHRPTAAAAGGYHPTGFLARHPASAYARESSCTECHNTGGFCADCHRQSGLTSQGPLQPGFHDAARGFLLGHGQAARRSLESCVSCHAERDCLTCHSAVGGRRFNPHGPGFDPERLRRRNSQMCSACHGAAIPTR